MAPVTTRELAGGTSFSWSENDSLENRSRLRWEDGRRHIVLAFERMSTYRWLLAVGLRGGPVLVQDEARRSSSLCGRVEGVASLSQDLAS